MKRLYLIRHAKSSWKHTHLDDFERPLNKRGYRDAPLMGQQLKQQGIKPQKIICSPAARAATTARLLCEQIGYDAEQIDYRAEIYDASFTNLTQLVGSLPAEIDEIFLIGHNPGFTDLANALGDQSISNIPTCGIVCLEQGVGTWSEFVAEKNHCKFFFSPKDFK